MTLSEFFSLYPEVVVAFSGGIDSVYLIYEASRYARKVQAIFVRAGFQPEFEMLDAMDFCKRYGVQLKIIEYNIFEHDEVTSNPKDRCYYCKRAIFGLIRSEAASLGYDIVIDGTNADDDENDRPGMRALNELEILSPLRMCGLTKNRIRQASREAGLKLWNKPSYACLATRIPYGEKITQEKIHATEQAEKFIMEMGFENFRVRLTGNTAKIQIMSSDFPRFMEHRHLILKALESYYDSVTLDLRGRDE